LPSPWGRGQLQVLKIGFTLARGLSLPAFEHRKLVGEGDCPAVVTQRMPFCQRARTAWHAKVPMVAAATSCQFTLAPNDFVPFQHGQWLAARIPGVDAHLTEEDGHITLLQNRVADVHEWLLAHF